MAISGKLFLRKARRVSLKTRVKAQCRLSHIDFIFQRINGVMVSFPRVRRHDPIEFPILLQKYTEVNSKFPSRK